MAQHVMPYAQLLTYWQLVHHQLQAEIKTAKYSTQRWFTCLKTDTHINSNHLIYKYKYTSNNKILMQQTQKKH